MPRRDDHYYRAQPDLFLNSRTRYVLDRHQWADYRDLLDLIYLHKGQVANDVEWLADELRSTVEDVEIVLAVEHFYETDDGKHIRHRKCDEEIADRDKARKYMSDLSPKGVEARQNRVGNRNGNRDGKPSGNRAGNRPYSQSVSQPASQTVSEELSPLPGRESSSPGTKRRADRQRQRATPGSRAAERGADPGAPAFDKADAEGTKWNPRWSRWEYPDGRPVDENDWNALDPPDVAPHLRPPPGESVLGPPPDLDGDR
jgi:uncharacterized protein YdaU (DUF1376 family)